VKATKEEADAYFGADKMDGKLKTRLSLTISGQDGPKFRL